MGTQQRLVRQAVSHSRDRCTTRGRRQGARWQARTRNADSGSTSTTSLGGAAVAPLPPADSEPAGNRAERGQVGEHGRSRPADHLHRFDGYPGRGCRQGTRSRARARSSIRLRDRQLNVQTGEGGGAPVPLGDGTTSSSSQSSSAQVTLRVPAEKLASVEAKAAKLGKVLSQSAAQSDVTQQHVDLSARLKNLQAEEIRLRGFLDKAVKVSEMLEIERELSRVRGEIEAMQAQIAYLDSQAAMATLTLALSAPGALVQPAGGTWGFSAAVTAGIQAAAALLRTLIIVIIALSPVLLVVVVIVAHLAFPAVVAVRRRARPKRTTPLPKRPRSPSDTLPLPSDRGERRSHNVLPRPRVRLPLWSVPVIVAALYVARSLLRGSWRPELPMDALHPGAGRHRDVRRGADPCRLRIGRPRREAGRARGLPHRCGRPRELNV